MTVALALFTATAAAAQAAEPPVVPTTTPAPTTDAKPAAPTDRFEGQFVFGLRAAWLVPAGYVEGQTASDPRSRTLRLDQAFGSGPQFTVEAGLRLPTLTLALFLEAGVVEARTPDCHAVQGVPGWYPGTSCSSGRSWKFGLEGLYHFMRDKSVSPFVGTGIGYEISQYDFTFGSGPAIEATSSTYSAHYNALYIEMQLGSDWKVRPDSLVRSVGPFVSASLGKYVRDPWGASSHDISSEGQRFHHWIQAGVRVCFGTR